MSCEARRTPPGAGVMTALLLVFAASGALAAPAPVADATKLFAEGKAAYGRRQYRAAALAFEEAFRVAPRGASIYNAGLSWQEADEPARAADSYMKALAAGDLAASLVSDARARLEVLQKKLGVLQIEAPPGTLVTVAHVVQGAAPLRVHLEPGRHEPRLSFPDGSATSEAIVLAAGGVAVLKPARPAERPAGAEPPAEARALRGEVPTGRILGWSALGVGAASALAAAGLGLAVLDQRQKYLGSNRLDGGAYERSIRLRTATNLAWAAAAALGATGTLLLVFWDSDDQGAATASLAAAPGGLGISLTLER